MFFVTSGIARVGAARANTLGSSVVHVLDRVLYAVQHTNATGALLLMGLAALAVAAFALWILLAVIRTLIAARPKR